MIGILMVVVFFYDILMVFEVNFFEFFFIYSGPEDGDGLNFLF